MKEIIVVFRMTEISREVRIKILKKLGRAINMEHGMDIAGDLVDELVAILEGEK